MTEQEAKDKMKEILHRLFGSTNPNIKVDNLKLAEKKQRRSDYEQNKKEYRDWERILQSI